MKIPRGSNASYTCLRYTDAAYMDCLHLMQVLLLTSIGNLQCHRLIIVILNYILFEIMVHRNYVYIQH